VSSGIHSKNLQTRLVTEGFPCFFLDCKANARVKPAKTGHGPHSSKFLCCSMYLCVVLCIFVLFYVFLCSMYFCVVLCIFCVLLCIFVLFYVFFVLFYVFLCSMYFCVLCIFMLFYVFFVFYVFFCCSMYFLCCSMYFCVVLCIFCVVCIFVFYVFLCSSMYFCVVLCIVCFVSFSVLFVCKCVLYYRHRVATQLQLTDMSYHISYHIISYRIISLTDLLYRAFLNRQPVQRRADNTAAWRGKTPPAHSLQ